MSSARTTTLSAPARYSGDVMVDHDIAVERPPRIGVVEVGELWLDSPREFVRVRGSDLRRVAQRAAVAREQQPGVDVLVDIDVMIDISAAGARARVAAADVNPYADTLVYIGTPTGLAGLVADIHAMGICDGAVLRPLLPDIATLIRDSVLSELDTMAHSRVPSPAARPA